jgi:D-erythronate 2-dehydrogenase
MRKSASRTHHLMRLMSPLARAFVRRASAYYKSPAKYADPWGAIHRTLGDPKPDHVAITQSACP